MNNVLCESCGIKQCKQPCGCKKPTCGCNKNCCGDAKPVIDVQAMSDDILTLSFNFNGVGTTYDYRSMIKAGESDTSLSADAIKRVLRYMAERHTDTISAKELGAILHLADLGDVDEDTIDNYSMLFYKKEATDECDTSANKWTGWNALDSQASSMNMVMGFTSSGSPISLSSPSSPSQQYLLGWNGSEKTAWTQLKTASAVPANAYQVYWDADAKEFVKVKVEGS